MDPWKIRKILQLIYDAFWFIQVETIKSINQKADNLLYETHGLKQLQVALHHREVLHLFRIQLDPLGGDHIASNGKDPIRFRWSNWHWEDHLVDGLGKKGKLGLVNRDASTIPAGPRSSSGNSWKGFVLHSEGNLGLLFLLLLHHVKCFSRLWGSLGKPEIMNIY